MALPLTRFGSLRRFREDLWYSLTRPSSRVRPLLVNIVGRKLPSRLRELRPPKAPPRGRRRNTPSLSKQQLAAWVCLRQFYRLPRSGPLRTLRRRLRPRRGRLDRHLFQVLEGRAAALMVRAGFCLPTAARQIMVHGRVLLGGVQSKSPGQSVEWGRPLRIRFQPRIHVIPPPPHLEVSFAAGSVIAFRPPGFKDLSYPFDLSLENVLSRP